MLPAIFFHPAISSVPLSVLELLGNPYRIKDTGNRESTLDPDHTQLQYPADTHVLLQNDHRILHLSRIEDALVIEYSSLICYLTEKRDTSKVTCDL